MNSPNSILIPFSFTLSMLFLAKLIQIHSFNCHLLMALKPQYTCILRTHPGVFFPQMTGKPGTSTPALACACYPWSSSCQPFFLENTPQYFEKYITDSFLPSLQRSNLFPCYYVYKPKPPFCPLISSFGVSLWVSILPVKIITATIDLGLLLLMILPPFSSAGILRVIFLTYMTTREAPLLYISQAKCNIVANSTPQSPWEYFLMECFSSCSVL